MIEMDRFLKSIHYEARDTAVFYTALSHKSYFKNNQSHNWGNNEKLEFLGDAVLDVVMADVLMDTFPDDNEGNLSRKRASLVNVDQLSELAMCLGVDQFLLMGEGEETQGLRKNKRILAGAMEAIIGAIYKDSGFDTTAAWVQKIYRETLSLEFSEHDYLRDYKTRFQEMAQELWKVTPNYQVKEVDGPDHKKMFRVEVFVGEKSFGEGAGESKKAASQCAAEVAIKIAEKEMNQKMQSENPNKDVKSDGGFND